MYPEGDWISALRVVREGTTVALVERIAGAPAFSGPMAVRFYTCSELEG